MYNLILALVIILSVLIVIIVMMQLGKQSSAVSTFTGGVDKLFGKQKACGFEAAMQCSTAAFGTIWMILLFVLAFLPLK